VMDKATEVRKIRAELNLQMDQTAFMGDDLPDLSAFLEVGLRIAPPQARAQVLRMAHATTRAKPGHGAVREVCDAFIRARLPRTGAP